MGNQKNLPGKRRTLGSGPHTHHTDGRLGQVELGYRGAPSAAPSQPRRSPIGAVYWGSVVWYSSTKPNFIQYKGGHPLVEIASIYGIWKKVTRICL